MCGDHLNLSVNDFYAKCMKCCARRLRTAASEDVSGVGREHVHGACRAGSAGAGVAGRESVGAAPPLGALRGVRAFRRDLWGYACAMVGGRTMAGERAVWFLEKTRRHMGRKSRDLGGKRCQPFAALACGVGDKAAAGVMGARQCWQNQAPCLQTGGRHDILPFLLHSFRPVRFVSFSLFVQTPCAPLFP